jgi:cobalamin biosynthesis protein CbiD
MRHASDDLDVTHAVPVIYRVTEADIRIRGDERHGSYFGSGVGGSGVPAASEGSTAICLHPTPGIPATT